MVGVMATSSLFTIEQIELIRRLRNTGISKKQVVEAFEQLEKLDTELGHGVVPVINSPPIHRTNGGGSSFEALAAVTAQMSIPHIMNQSENNLNITITKVESMNTTKTSTPCPVLNGGFLGANSSDIASSVQFCPRYGDSFSLQSSVSSDSAIEVSGNSRVQTPPSSSASPTSRLPSGLTIIPLTPNGSSASDVVMTKSNDVSLQCLLNPMDFYHDDSVVELDELKKKGEEAILSEIRSFVMRYNIKQTMIAEMTKLCQAYVSRFFRGDTSDMSEKTKNTFYSWYLTCKNNPWKLAQLCPNSGVKRMVSESGDLIPLKRERFTFKAAHLTVLEKYYDKDPYPDGHTREIIVEECNRAMERLVGDSPMSHLTDRRLSEREKVSLPVINNWFNNRRKEAKKQMRQQHAAAMAVANGLPQQQQGVVGSAQQLLSQLSLPLTCPMSSGNWIPSITMASAPSSSSSQAHTSPHNSNNHNGSNHSSSDEDDDSSGGNFEGSDDVMVIAEDDEDLESQTGEIKTET